MFWHAPGAEQVIAQSALPHVTLSHAPAAEQEIVHAAALLQLIGPHASAVAHVMSH